MLRTRPLLTYFLCILLLALFTSLGIWKRVKANTPLQVGKKETVISDPFFEKLKKKSTEAAEFVKKNKLNPSVCFLIDMSMPSGDKRFFVYDITKDSIRKTGLVTHGRCNQMWLDGRKYSNVPGCGCTSLGKYKIGCSYSGRFGLAYKLHGLDKTNSNAFKRYVVLHAHECVPEMESEDEICQSDGCPTVAPGFLQQLKPLIDKSSKPVLLLIYE